MQAVVGEGIPCKLPVTACVKQGCSVGRPGRTSAGRELQQHPSPSLSRLGSSDYADWNAVAAPTA